MPHVRNHRIRECTPPHQRCLWCRMIRNIHPGPVPSGVLFYRGNNSCRRVVQLELCVGLAYGMIGLKLESTRIDDDDHHSSVYYIQVIA